MKTRCIYKYTVNYGTAHKISMPKLAEVLHCGFRGEQVTLWVEVEIDMKTDDPKNYEIRTFQIIGTGQKIPNEGIWSVYIGTCQSETNSSVWHVYEIHGISTKKTKQK